MWQWCRTIFELTMQIKYKSSRLKNQQVALLKSEISRVVFSLIGFTSSVVFPLVNTHMEREKVFATNQRDVVERFSSIT